MSRFPRHCSPRRWLQRSQHPMMSGCAKSAYLVSVEGKPVPASPSSQPRVFLNTTRCHCPISSSGRPVGGLDCHDRNRRARRITCKSRASFIALSITLHHAGGPSYVWNDDRPRMARESRHVAVALDRGCRSAIPGYRAPARSLVFLVAWVSSTGGCNDTLARLQRF